MGGKKKIVSKKAQEEEAQAQLKNEKKESAPIMADGIPIEVVEVIGKSGVFGEIYQVMVKVLAGRDQGRVIRRNVKGPIRKGDLLMVLETEREAKPIKSKR